MGEVASDYFTYTPVRGAPETAAAVFLVVALVIAYQIVRARAARWMYILVGTAVAESVGYILRIVCINHIRLGLYIAMILFLLLPPNALALYNYKVVGEVVRRSNVRARRFWLKAKFITWFFFASDVFSFMLQSTGGSMMSHDSLQKTGKWICIVGLAIQLVFLAVFVFVAIVVHRDPQYIVACGPRQVSEAVAKRRVMWTIHVTTALLYVRSVYRLIEFADGYGGSIYKAEWAFYVFDFGAILLMFVMYIVFFLGHNFPRKTIV
ncbi:hypothetical protein GGI04_002116 [Coemansia thaxteri]|uniref:RTA1 like protein n=1 Tax=Coemansia thaxteri TaxID=2663907 RepID=A0A9W8EK74_9FUNG|nr:hypothetical protein H4R26_002371 [Coemansia thaxteri]KAJ2005764.1 hypothetical protein GGI04_002116 [Coemansia thaxteri]KAJ2472955.1 hypothetical protein GGI02_001220 [Coemansia sp. RSA 2322]KAJ2485182.1 hypothetical protein EV174_001894 [Coemansia sp. RSA 2320]